MNTILLLPWAVIKTYLSQFPWQAVMSYTEQSWGGKDVYQNGPWKVNVVEVPDLELDLGGRVVRISGRHLVADPDAVNFTRLLIEPTYGELPAVLGIPFFRSNLVRLSLGSYTVGKDVEISRVDVIEIGPCHPGRQSVRKEVVFKGSEEQPSMETRHNFMLEGYTYLREGNHEIF
ncbi:MAG: hypothetical protein M1825_004155 [Sarcosagium campestre]|nr:MAG: hypothetical protein M1825_004155 [Sarcosagium campestre]